MAIMELADRCEQATGPDWQLDLDISEATGVWRTLPSFREWHPTASLDAAMSLVPADECEVLDLKCDLDRKQCRATLTVLRFLTDFQGVAATPALALCAASLRALARARAEAVTHCPHGHEYTPENTYNARRSNGKPYRSRQCRTCNNARRERYRSRAMKENPDE